MEPQLLVPGLHKNTTFFWAVLEHGSEPGLEGKRNGLTLHGAVG